jgi:thioredoxin 1
MLEDERIGLIIPEGANEGDIWICINPGGSGACPPTVCRLAEPDTDRYFEVVWPPLIEEFSANDGEDRVEVEACTDIRIKVSATSAERAVITERDTGAEVWDWVSPPEGRPRALHIEESFPVRDLRDSTAYVLEVENLCRTDRRDLEMVIYHAVHLAASAARVAVGGTVDLTIRVSCPAPAGGLRVQLTSSPADALPVPNEVVIPEGEIQSTVTLTAADLSAEVEIRGEAPDHRRDSVIILVSDVPVITRVSPLEVDACSSFELEVQGDGFDPEASGNLVDVTDDSQWVPLEVDDIRSTNPDDRVHDAVLEVVAEHLLPGSWYVYVTSYGLRSERFAHPIVAVGVRSVTDEDFDTVVLGATGLVLVDFYAVWCFYCGELAPILEELAPEFSGQVLFAKMDIDENRITTGRFGISDLPALLLFNNGQEIGRHVGFLYYDELQDWVRSLIG